MEPVRIDRLAAEQVAVLRAGYEDAFPPELRVAFDSLRDDDVVAFLDGEAPAGLAVVRMLDAETAFLRYFYAVARGRGAGTRMWAALEEWSREQGARTLLLDVEDPTEEIDDPEEIRIRGRRVVFYERNGAQVLPLAGYAPEHSGLGDEDGHVHAPAMQLLEASLDLPPHARQPLPEERLRELVVLVMTRRYGYRVDDPEVLRLVSG